MKIAIIGTGAYSLGIASILAKNDKNNIILWTENKDKYEEFNQYHKISQIFENIVYPNNVSITLDYEQATKDVDLIFLVTSVKYIVNVLNNIKPYYNNVPICIASKGIEHTTLNVLSNVVKNILHTNKICVISGPTFAIDLVNNSPAALAIAGLNKKIVKFVKDNLSNKTLKLRISKDIIGIQLCGSIKNIIAIASGIIGGLGYPESTQAFLLNESIHDMKNAIHALGGKRKTILSFAGFGDLLLTCTSIKSRNYSFGYLIGKTKDKKQITEYLENNTVEGYYTLDSVIKMLEKKGIEIPLFNIINDIILCKKDPNELIEFLINKS